MKFHMLDLGIFIIRPAVSVYQLSAVMVLQSFKVNNKLLDFASDTRICFIVWIFIHWKLQTEFEICNFTVCNNMK